MLVYRPVVTQEVETSLAESQPYNVIVINPRV
jgi:hypothetical protein